MNNEPRPNQPVSTEAGQLQVEMTVGLGHNGTDDIEKVLSEGLSAPAHSDASAYSPLEGHYSPFSSPFGRSTEEGTQQTAWHSDGR